MNTTGGKLSQDYGWEITILHKLRAFSDGLSLLELRINWDRYLADHTPRFELHLVLLNITIVELNIYYLHHRMDAADGDDMRT
jgi:hypothetical protein